MSTAARSLSTKAVNISNSGKERGGWCPGYDLREIQKVALSMKARAIHLDSATSVTGS